MNKCDDIKFGTCENEQIESKFSHRRWDGWRITKSQRTQFLLFDLIDLRSVFSLFGAMTVSVSSSSAWRSCSNWNGKFSARFRFRRLILPFSARLLLTLCVSSIIRFNKIDQNYLVLTHSLSCIEFISLNFAEIFFSCPHSPSSPSRRCPTPTDYV